MRMGVMSAPVLSRASLSTAAKENSARADCRGVMAGSLTQNNKLFPSRCVRAATRSLSNRPYRARRSSPFSSEGLDRRAYSMRSSVPRGSDSATWMPSASSPVRSAARRHAVSVTASGTRILGSSSLIRPKSRRMGAALTLRLSTHAMRYGSTHPCTVDAMTAWVRLLVIRSDSPAASARGFNRLVVAHDFERSGVEASLQDVFRPEDDPRLDQPRDQSGPSRLVAGADPRAVVAME